MLATETRPEAHGASQLDDVRAAFHALHGRSVHGFALLLTLGDRAAAARLASDALAQAGARVDELRHPERAAAWMRARIVQEAPRGRRAIRPNRDAVADLGADDGVTTALASLDHFERAALIASVVERLDLRDVAVVVGRDGSRLHRLIARGRQRYADAYLGTDPGEITDGPISTRLRDIAHRAIG